MKRIITTQAVLIFLLASISVAAGSKISKTLDQRISAAGKDQVLPCWIYFNDKGGQKDIPPLPGNSLERRAKAGRSFSYGDIPVDGKYLEAVRLTGAQTRVVSPWLNAVSVNATPAQIAALEALPAVCKIEPVLTMMRPAEKPQSTNEKTAAAVDYGSSQTQIQLMKVDQLHQKGYSGRGVRLTIIDTGFDRWHESLRRVKVLAERDFQRVLPGGLPDTVTSFEADQDSSYSQTWHGTGMLSIAGGYEPGELIGSSYNADFILAKTERYSGDDFQQEEDWFVQAVQWATDSVGTDIISSSLGYRYWSDTASYSYLQMDGKTTLSAIALDSASSRGVLVLNSIGNVNTSFTTLTTRPDTCIATPADAHGILTVGGVWATSLKWADPVVGSSGERVTGAASGPPSDSIKILPTGRSDSVYIRRIKPEIASSWQNYYAYNEPDDDGNFNRYASSIGTSGATVLTAGLCALLLEAHPSWAPQDVMNALKFSGSNRRTVEAFYAAPESLDIALGTYPNYNPGFADIATGHEYFVSGADTSDLYDVYRIGWGVPDGIKALYYTQPEVVYPEVVLPEKDQLLDPYPNPVKSSDGGIYLPFYLVQDSYEVTIRIYTLDGRMVRKIELGNVLGSYPIPFERNDSQRPAFWDLKNDKGQPVPGGLYIALLSTGWNQSSKKIVVLR